MLIKPSDHPRFLSTFMARGTSDHRQSTGALIEVRAGSIESFDQIDLKPPVSALQRPFSSKAWGRNPSSQVDTNQKPASFRSKKSKTQVKTHQSATQEKNPAPLGTSIFNKIPPLLKACDNLRLSLAVNHSKGSSSLSYRTSKDGMLFDTGNADSIVQGKEAFNPSMTKSKMVGKKKSPSAQVSPDRVRKPAFAEPEKMDGSPSHIMFNSSGLEPQKVDSISTRLKNGLPIAKFNSLAVHITGHKIEEKNVVNSARGHEEGFHSDRQSDYREHEPRKVKEPAMSQAMFRMKHYQKNKEAASKKNKDYKEAKEAFNVALESSMKSFTHRQFAGLNHPNEKYNSREWKKDVFKTLETEFRDGDRLFTEEFGRHSTLSTYAGSPNDFVFIKKRTSTLAGDNQTLSKAIKFTDYQKEKQEIMKKFFNENGSLKVLGNERQTHFEAKEKEKGQEDARKSTKMSPKTKKVDMQMFLDALGSPKTPRSYSQNMNHIGMFKTEVGEQTPRRVEQKLSERKSEKQFSTFSEKQQIELNKMMVEKKEEIPKLVKVESQKSVESKQSNSNMDIKIVKKVTKINKTSIPTNTPKSTSIQKQNLNERLKNLVEKDKEMTPKDEGISPKKKRTYNNLAEVGELSQLSIKQFEMSGSWDHEAFELMQQRNDDYLSSEIK